MSIADDLPALYPVAYGVAYRHLGPGDHDAVADAVQDSMVKALAYRGEIHDLTAWLAVTVTNTCRDALRRQRRRPQALELWEYDGLYIEGRFDAVESRETIAALHRLLTPGQWAALVLAAEGYSMEDIAGVVGADVGAVKGRMYLGRCRARAWRRNVGD